MYDRLNAGVDVHPSDQDAKEFQNLAKLIDPDRYFTVYGCQKCINELVKFVFDNADKLPTTFIKAAKFPKDGEA